LLKEQSVSLAAFQKQLPAAGYADGLSKAGLDKRMSARERPHCLSTQSSASDQLRYRLSVARNHDGLALLDQIEEPGDLGLSFVDIHLHVLTLSPFF
jgi:hypothetical protein